MGFELWLFEIFRVVRQGRENWRGGWAKGSWGFLRRRVLQCVFGRLVESRCSVRVCSEIVNCWLFGWLFFGHAEIDFGGSLSMTEIGF
jgi:hypothetical protein